MRTVDIIQRKRDGLELTAVEIQALVDGYVKGNIPDYQMSAWAMAVYFQGMTARETADLTMAMAKSGDMMDLSDIAGVKVDKHSTGGVGDTTTLVLAPLVAAHGVPVAKMSGRGLGHTGGTIDKLEAIAGFQVERTREQFIDQVNKVGAAVIGQSGNITPADKKLYGLRDVTATVNSIPLIASSIMSKKLASGADAIVLDVKTGKGAFMKTLDDSIALAQAMVEIGTQVGRETVALITDMEQPLGYAIGNSLEVQEAIDTLRGIGPSDLELLSIELGAHMLMLGGKASSVGEASEMLRASIQDGRALQKLKDLVAAQQGDSSAIDDPSKLPQAKVQMEIPAQEAGYITSMEAEQLGTAAMLLGAGRETKESTIDLAAGLLLRKKVGDTIQAGEPLAVLHTNLEDPARIEEVVTLVQNAIRIDKHKVEAPPLVYAVITKDGVKRFGNA